MKEGAELGSFKMWWKDGDAPLPEDSLDCRRGLTSGGDVEGSSVIEADAV